MGGFINRFVSKKINKAFGAALAALLTVFVLLTVCLAGSTDMLHVFAAAADISPGNTASPTPVVNEIGSTGDFTIRASYEDNSVFEDNMAVNADSIGETDGATDIVNAVRLVEREKDIFVIMKLSLQINGRDTALTKSMNIHVMQADWLEKYTDISVFYIDETGTARKISSTEGDGGISFTVSNMGIFAFSGMEAGSSNETPHPTDGSEPLQTDTNTGIISPLQTSVLNNNSGENDADEAVTPGAFVLWLAIAVLIGIWIGLGIGYILWGRYKTKKVRTGPRVIGE